MKSLKKYLVLFLTVIIAFSIFPNVQVKAENARESETSLAITEESLNRIVESIQQDENGKYFISEDIELTDEERKIAEITVGDMNGLSGSMRSRSAIISVVISVIATFLISGLTYSACANYKNDVYNILYNWEFVKYGVPEYDQTRIYYGGWLFVNSCNAQGW